MTNTDIVEHNKAVMARLLNTEQVQDRLNVGRSTVFKLILSGELRSVKIGARRLVPEAAVADYIAALSA